MSSKNEMIKNLKVNLALYNELSYEEQVFLEGKKLLVLRDDGVWEVAPRYCRYPALRYRLPAYYHEESEPEYAVCAIDELLGRWWCHEVECAGRLYGGFSIDVLPRKVGFSGVQFEGQRDKRMWSMDVACSIDADGNLMSAIFDDSAKPATPIRARFLVK